MKLDNEQQRTLLLQLIDQAQFPGSARKVVFELGQAIETAEVTGEPSGAARTGSPPELGEP